MEPPERSSNRKTRGGPGSIDVGLVEPRGNRTPDLYNAIVALSQLSYGPIEIMNAVMNAR